MKAIRKMDKLTAGLITIGAINWGLAAMARRDAVGGAYVKRSTLPRIIYGAVGISAIYKLVRGAAPKTKHERRQEAIERAMFKLETLYDKLQVSARDARKQMEQGQKQMKTYRKQLERGGMKPAWR